MLAGIAVDALAAGIAAPWAAANAATESLGAGGWVRGLAFIAVSVAAPVAAAMTLSRGVAIPPFSRVLGRVAERPSSVLALASGAILVVATVLALQTALGLVFDPRYRDLTFAPMTAAVILFAVAVGRRRKVAGRGSAGPNSSPPSPWRRRRSTSSSTKASRTGRRCGSPPRWRCSPSPCIRLRDVQST